MKRVLIESPFKAPTADLSILYSQYLARAIHDCFKRNEAPFASHGFYTLFLNDTIDEERRKGICAGFAWGEAAELVAVYVDYGISNGMKAGISKWKQIGIPFETRLIGKT